MFDQHQRRQWVRQHLVRLGFVSAYETTAVVLLKHPDHPRVLVRMGNTRIVAEVDGVECYRSPLSDFDPDRLWQLLDDSGGFESANT